MILAVLQARVSSTRLPGKVLKPILGVPMLLRQIERVKNATLIDELIVATSEEASDDLVADLCHQNQVGCFRGSLNDVLDRFYQAAQSVHPEHVVRLTGDCPLSDPEVIDLVIATHLAQGNDYTSNALEPTYPDGLDVEIMRRSALETAWQEAVLKSQREHVTPFIYQHPERFQIGVVTNDCDLSQLRWTVDQAEDFEVIKLIYQELYDEGKVFGLKDILALLERRPEIERLNNSFQRNEGYTKSLREDLG